MVNKSFYPLRADEANTLSLGAALAKMFEGSAGLIIGSVLPDGDPVRVPTRSWFSGINALEVLGLIVSKVFYRTVRECWSEDDFPERAYRLRPKLSPDTTRVFMIVLYSI